MYQLFLLACALDMLVVAASLLTNTLPNLDTMGFEDAIVSRSSGGNAMCISGLVSVNTSTPKNLRLNIASTISLKDAVEIILGLATANSNLTMNTVQSQQPISGEFNINAQLCYPVSQQNTSTIQFLTHGVAFSSSYWDFSLPNNSYIETAAEFGHITFSYDRLGVGRSSRPDPIQVVQGSLHVAIAEKLIQMLRQGQLGNKKFSRVIGVGHSYGSLVTTTVAASSPSAFDAIIVTGFSSNRTGGAQFTAALNLEPAILSPTERFPDLPSGYLLPSTKYGIQYSFFRAPNFEDAVLARSFSTVETTTVGEQFSRSSISAPAINYTGPVFLVNGQNDLDFCDGDCFYPTNLAVTTLKAVFPNAAANKSGTYLLPGAGHGVNLAANAPLAFDVIQKFVASLGF